MEQLNAFIESISGVLLKFFEFLEEFLKRSSRIFGGIALKQCYRIVSMQCITAIKLLSLKLGAFYHDLLMKLFESGGIILIFVPGTLFRLYKNRKCCGLRGHTRLHSIALYNRYP